MATITDEERARRFDALRRARDENRSIASAAAELGNIGANALRNWARENPLNQPRRSPPPAAGEAPAERHDRRYWRRRAQDAERGLDEATKMIEQLGGIRSVPVQTPEWARGTPGRGGRSVLICHTSDWHLGEVIRSGEVDGLNRFDVDVCRQRLERYFAAACEIGARWSVDTDCQGALLTLAGDLISGDLHEEHLRTNELTSHEQVAAAIECAEAGIRLLLEAVPRVHVVAVPGNHGRTTRKPTAKLYGALSYDILIAAMLAERMAGEDRVTWQVDGATDQMVPILGHPVMVTHGDKIGTAGGQGFAGPVLPMLRGGHKIRLQHVSAGKASPFLLIGHYHTSAAPPGMLANGSVPGYSEFGRDIRAAVEPPSQWLALWHERWALRERLDVKLEPPPRPTIRVRAPSQIARPGPA